MTNRFNDSKPSHKVSQIDQSTEEELVRIGFDVPISLRNEFKSKVAMQGKKVRDVLESYMREYVKS